MSLEIEKIEKLELKIHFMKDQLEFRESQIKELAEDNMRFQKILDAKNDLIHELKEKLKKLEK